MGKKGKKAQAGKAKKLTPKDVGKRLDALVKKLEEELKGADLFAPLPPTEDCPICLVPLSRIRNNNSYRSCCGKFVCLSCSKENELVIEKLNEENAEKSKPLIPDLCAFCREPDKPADKAFGLTIARMEARCARGDTEALIILGIFYSKGHSDCGGTLRKDEVKALDCFIQAVELGSDQACHTIGLSYSKGLFGVPKSAEKEALLRKVAAVRGSVLARNGIGHDEYKSGNHEIGIRHWKIAAEAGMQPSLDELKKIYNADGKMPGKEFISKAYLDGVYRVCHEAQEEVKSEAREKHCVLEGALAKMKC